MACKYDGANPNAELVCFSPGNPYLDILETTLGEAYKMMWNMSNDGIPFYDIIKRGEN